MKKRDPDAGLGVDSAPPMQVLPKKPGAATGLRKAPATRSNSERRAAETVPDLRARRSKDALHHGVLSLIDEMPFTEITIDDIAVRAQISRATFYRHYPTKEALIEHIAISEIERLVDVSLPLLSSTDAHATCIAICRYVDERRALWSTLLTGGAAGAMRETFIRLAQERGPQQLDGLDTTIPLDLGATCGVMVTVEILAWWLRQDTPDTIETIAEYMERLALIH